MLAVEFVWGLLELGRYKLGVLGLNSRGLGSFSGLGFRVYKAEYVPILLEQGSFM